MITIEIKKCTRDAKFPHKATEDAAGYDLYANEEKLLKAGEFEIISTGIAIGLPLAYEAQIRPRSGLAMKHGITIINSPGTIDADYRGEIKIGLINHSKEDFLVEKDMRIAQMIISQIVPVNFLEKEELSITQRGAGGFGSTGLH